MSSSSGVPVSDSLRAQFQSARPNIRYIHVKIVNEELKGVATGASQRSFEEDIDLISKLLEPKDPCFVVIFKDGKGLLLLAYAPDAASVKAKMVYSSSKSALRRMLGGNDSTVEEWFVATPQECSCAAYRKRRATQGPLSYVEEQLQMLPKSLSADEMKKSAGYGLLAQLSGNIGITKPSEVRATSPRSPYSPNLSRNPVSPRQINSGNQPSFNRAPSDPTSPSFRVGTGTPPPMKSSPESPRNAANPAGSIAPRPPAGPPPNPGPAVVHSAPAARSPLLADQVAKSTNS